MLGFDLALLIQLVIGLLEALLGFLSLGLF